MQLLIFGATGSLGSHILKQALAKGYKVSVFTRHPARLKGIESAELTIITGDVFRLSDVKSAMRGINAVFCALGDGAKGNVRAGGTQNIVKAMEELGVKRLICQTTLGVGNSWQNLNFFWKYIMFGFLLKKAFQDHIMQEKYVTESNLDYTLVRPSAFTDEPATANFHIGFNTKIKNLRLKIPRADVANFMLEQLDTDKFIGKIVNIST